jgi:methionyl-tRNA formyltransferase
LAKAEGVIDWRWPAARIHNLVRGLWPWPHASTWVDTTRYIIHRSRLSERHAAGATPGTVLAASPSEGLHVATGDGVLELVEIQLEGKRAMPARDALAGLPLHVGSRFHAP